MAEDEPRGILCTLTPWKAALVGPFVDYVGLATILPLLPFFLLDLYKQIDLTSCPEGSRGDSYLYLNLTAAQAACSGVALLRSPAFASAPPRSNASPTLVRP